MTRASLFAEAGKRTPVFVRFSTVVGERGSTDTPRDVRGFAVKFYTDEGNWDLVGNNIPVFFIQDAMKFPDLVHAAKPEPHFAMPQAATAHDTFWDFVSLMPESTHMMMWAMSDRAIPRSYRMMQGFGVHTFRLVNERGKSTFVKFHWNPVLGTHSLDWDEAVKIAGADPDFHRRDLWEAIEAGAFPEWELGFQMFTEEQAEAFSFDVLDATKIVPEELVPVTPVGRMVLNRNPDNFFAETEQVAFCTAHIVPGIDFTNDPLLAGRIHSYSTRRSRAWAGRTFTRFPINSPVAPVHNNQRDGMHRQAIHRGRVAYEPNSLGGGCPFQAGARGLHVVPRADRGRQGARQAREIRRALHSGHAVLEQPDADREGAHHPRLSLRADQGADARRSGERMVATLANVDAELAETLARELGIELPEPLPKALKRAPKPEVEVVAGALAVRASRRRQHPHAPGRDLRGRRRRRGIRRGGARGAGGAGRRAPLRRRAPGNRADAGRRRAGGRGHLRDHAVGVIRRHGRAGRQGGGRDAGQRGTRRGVHQGPVPPCQADPRARRRGGPGRERGRAVGAAVGRARPRHVDRPSGDGVGPDPRLHHCHRRHRHFERQMDPPEL